MDVHTSVRARYYGLVILPRLWLLLLWSSINGLPRRIYYSTTATLALKLRYQDPTTTHGSVTARSRSIYMVEPVETQHIPRCIFAALAMDLGDIRATCVEPLHWVLHALIKDYTNIIPAPTFPLQPSTASPSTPEDDSPTKAT